MVWPVRSCTASAIRRARTAQRNGARNSSTSTARSRQPSALGYDYTPSKRTDVYAAYMYDHFDKLSSGDTFGAGIRMKF